MITEDILAGLRSIVGASGLKTADALSLINPGADEHNLDAGVMVVPQNTGQVAAILHLCNEQGIAVVPHGGRTGLAGGAVSTPGEIILSLAAMTRIESLSATAGTAIVESGVTLQALQEAAAAVNLSTGIDIASRGSATIGGMISTNAGGMEAFRHGVMRHRVLGLEVVLPDGSIMSEMAQVSKSNEGYDLKQLFIGAEGTLGIVTRAVIRLAPSDEFTATALVACPSATSAVALFQTLQRNRGLNLLRAEFMARTYFALAARDLGPASLAAFTQAPAYLILETDATDQLLAQSALEEALANGIEEGLVADAILAQSEKGRSEIWNIREDSNVVTRAYPHGYWFDISVPLQELETWLKQFEQGIAALGPDISGFAFGHLGDGNLHVGVAGESVNPDKDAVKAIIYANLKQMGGSFSAEHGIGLEKKPELKTLIDPVKLALMQSIKKTIDPKGIMNPGKIIG
ncbi:FAD-binding oxidoreductase [Phyllobacterium brassicacearum]|uniref:FAD-binding oxidoreductase n=1 Tax=Phyllobacterium brassicacearum TaxID=314235 RepID=A0A2P7BS74_9HYPH|nr:FAD-binding oxidoreductase [Phyllobacterium brassicacearum]PSH69262.1 FAD-binding oxidoreductase [Phyllobacterium brassicacearum]TDQ34574.1 FAD/FMN-containing dehydrogenase [Phyllobacterium brassicacearum]